VGLEVLTVLLESRTNPPRAYEASSSGGDVDDISTGIINDTTLEEESAAPKGECAWWSMSVV
jgi:hypothetical protein